MKISRRFEKIEREDILRMAETFLWDPDAQIARDYLMKTRMLSEDVLRSFRIGYLPDDLNHQLHGRVIMPLFDASGNLITITSRIIRDPLPTDELPRYWHESYEKSFYLYGVNIAKEYMRKWNFAVLVEGQFDVLQLHNHGLKNAVAICGTSLSNIQYATILRYCDEVVLMLDNDENQSGQKAIEKIIRTSSKCGVQWREWKYCDISQQEQYKITCVKLEAKDPDEYIKSFGYERLLSKIQQAIAELRAIHVN